MMNIPLDRLNSPTDKKVNELRTTNELLNHLLDRMDYICDRLSPKEEAKQD
jgi:hypothetical protein